eukprot:9606412-Karenia_brevis.AAC.1
MEYEADSKHRRIVLEYSGFDDCSKVLSVIWDREEKIKEWDLELLGKKEAKECRGVAASLNFMSLGCPDLQSPIKESSRDMDNPNVGSWKMLKKVA